MKKNISFFNIIYNIIIALAFYILLLGVSFVIVSTIEYSHTKEEINYIDQGEIYIEGAKSVNMYFDDNDMYIIAKFDQAQPESKLLSYAYQYKAKFNKNIYLECQNANNYVFITINLDGKAVIS